MDHYLWKLNGVSVLVYGYAREQSLYFLCLGVIGYVWRIVWSFLSALVYRLTLNPFSVWTLFPHTTRVLEKQLPLTPPWRILILVFSSSKERSCFPKHENRLRKLFQTKLLVRFYKGMLILMIRSNRVFEINFAVQVEMLLQKL